MSEFIYLIPALTVLTGALVLMFMSMYEKFTVKNFIVVSSIFLFIALGFDFSSFLLAFLFTDTNTICSLNVGISSFTEYFLCFFPIKK